MAQRSLINPVVCTEGFTCCWFPGEAHGDRMKPNLRELLDWVKPLFPSLTNSVFLTTITWFRWPSTHSPFKGINNQHIGLLRRWKEVIYVNRQLGRKDIISHCSWHLQRAAVILLPVLEWPYCSPSILSSPTVSYSVFLRPFPSPTLNKDFST